MDQTSLTCINSLTKLITTLILHVNFSTRSIEHLPLPMLLGLYHLISSKNNQTKPAVHVVNYNQKPGTLTLALTKLKICTGYVFYLFLLQISLLHNISICP